ncbi:MAG: peptidylprolyl isomerase [Rikenellaceae bacterium]|jgi:peptidyl-prolyl cis-trans isomerase SurA|nr:peptidylprolyl isomerase [Rikenellaceae bacterium]
MKRIGLVLIALLAGVFATTAPLRAQDNTQIGEEIVAVVGGSMIMWSDVVEMMHLIEAQQRAEGYTSNREPRCEALEELLLQKMLANQARLDSLAADMTTVEQMVEAEVNQLMLEYGSLLAVEAALRKPVYQIRDNLREKYTDMALAQTMEMTIRSGTEVTPAEVERFYRRMNRDSLPMTPEMYMYSQIVMYPPSLDAAKLRARERLLELRQRIIDGQNFGTLARLYSVDTGTARQGGESDFTPLDGLVRPFREALARLRPDQISPVVETEYGFHIIQMIESRGNDYRFRHILIKPEYTTEEMTQTAQRLDSVGQLIRNGELTFAEAALQYSQDDYTKFNGGQVTNREIVELYGASARATTNRFTREELYGDYQALRLLKPGDISTSYMTQDVQGNQQVKIVKLDEIIPSHRANINEDYSNIEDMAIVEKQQKKYNDWLSEKIAAMYVRIDPKYQNCDFVYDWVK